MTDLEKTYKKLQETFEKARKITENNGEIHPSGIPYRDLDLLKKSADIDTMSPYTDDRDKWMRQMRMWYPEAEQDVLEYMFSEWDKYSNDVNFVADDSIFFYKGKEYPMRESLKEAQEEIIGEIEEVVDPAEEIPAESDMEAPMDEAEAEFDPKVLASNFVEEVRDIFESWSMKMDGLYPNEQRHDATMWEQGSPNDWMTPFSQELYEAWIEYDTGNAKWFESLVPFLKAYTEE